MLKKMRFDVKKELTGAELGHVNMIIMSWRRKDLLDKVNMDGYLTRSDVKELIEPFRNVVANAPGEPMAVISASIVEKFEKFLG